MVVNDSKSLFSLIDNFNPNNQDHLLKLEELSKNYPNFHLVRAYYLKALQKRKVSSFDKILSHTSVATYDRDLLYQFIETDLIARKSSKKKSRSTKDKLTSHDGSQVNEEKNIDANTKSLDISSKTLKFSEWAIFLNSDKKLSEKNDNLENFQLLDDLLKIPERIIPDKNYKNIEDLSEKSWSPNDELMTETLAKVFVKQKKYRKAIEAYQILGLKYPEKNSLFANQIKEIKKLKKQKNSR